MKKYIIFRAYLTGMGGAQMYVRNKAIYEEKQGYEVYVCSANKGKIVIEDLKKYHNCIIEELKLSPCTYSKKERKSIIEKIIKLIRYEEKDEVIIESNDVILSLWGELLAQRIQGKNFAFILNEEYSDYEKHFWSFFAFKHNRKELAGINENSLCRLFEGNKLVKENERYYLSAVCANVVDDCEHPIVEEINHKHINIGSIGRLNKEYVPTLCSELVRFAQKHPDQKIDVLFIGDSSEKDMTQEIARIFRTCENLSFLVTGYMYPIPRKLFPKINVFVSAAGSTRPSYNEKRPTISIDVSTHLSIGIIGYNTMNTLYAREDDEPTDISDALEVVLFGKGITYKYTEDLKVDVSSLSDHDRFIDNSEKSKEYFEIGSIEMSWQEYILRVLNAILGSRLVCEAIFPFLRSKKNTLKRSKGK